MNFVVISYIFILPFVLMGEIKGMVVLRIVFIWGREELKLYEYL